MQDLHSRVQAEFGPVQTLPFPKVTCLPKMMPSLAGLGGGTE